MSFWFLLQILINIVLFAAVGFMWVRLQKPAKDDPRLSRGLQLLQSKISVLEDLSDRTETQARQLTTLLEQKCREVQGVVLQTEKQLQKIESSMEKSREVAKIFQDKIPHQEIIERQNTLKYIKAARLAHQGLSVDDIAKQVDLARGELEFIANVNRQQLQFSEADLPDWARGEAPAETMQEARPEDMLSNLGSKFRQAFGDQAFAGESAQTADKKSQTQDVSALSEQQKALPQESVADNVNQYAQAQVATNTNSHIVAASYIPQQIVEKPVNNGPVIKKVVFPKVEVRGPLV